MTDEPTGTGALVIAFNPIATGMIKQLEMLQVGQLATVSYVAPNLQRTLKLFVLFPGGQKKVRVTNFQEIFISTNFNCNDLLNS